MRIFFLTALLTVCFWHLQAQSLVLDSVKTELYRINKVYDSARYLGFAVGIQYSTDSLLGSFNNDETWVEYILNGNNIYYKSGNDEYIQNDSFSYSIFHEDKTMLVTKELNEFKSSFFPLREFVDSVITWYDTSYYIDLQDVDTLSAKLIRFTAKYDTLPYKTFSIFYLPESYFLLRIEMSMESPFEKGMLEDSLVLKIKTKPLQRRIVMNFSNYQYVQNVDVFQDRSYLIYDRFRKQYSPARKYRGYRLLLNGLEGVTDDETIEEKAPPEEEIVN